MIDELLKQLAAEQYPHQVDVVDSVMSQVSARPYLRPVRRVQSWQRWTSGAVAAVIILLAVNLTVSRIQANDNAGIGYMIAQVQDYNYYGSTIEDEAVNPIEYLYEEE